MLRKAKIVWKNAKLTALARGGYGCALADAARLWRAEGLDGLRRGLALLAAQAELSPGEGGFAPDDYAEWVRRYDTPDGPALERMRRRAKSLASKPRFSLILSVGGDAQATMRSLLAQAYENWELLVPAGTPDGDVLAADPERDPRIRTIPGGPAHTLAQAFAQAGGDYAGLLRAGDLLAPHALLCAALAITAKPETELLYADEDRLDGSGARSAPWFKPDRNPELMLAQDMFSGLCLFRRQTALEAGGPREEFGPWTAYDLAWRVMERAGAVAHVPRVLCHRAFCPAPEQHTGQHTGQQIGLRAAQEHLDRAGVSAIAVPAPGIPVQSDMIRVLHRRPGPDAVASILIPTRDRADLLAACVRSIREHTLHQGYEIIVIDNGSVERATHELFDELRAQGVRIVSDPAPFNYSRVNNNGAREARGGFLCLMNNDIEVLDGDWLGEMLSFAALPDVGCVGARLWYPDGTLQHGGILRGVCGFAGHAHIGLAKGEPGYFGRAALHQELCAVTAACLVVRRTVFEQVGGLDETLPESYNDVDLCLRVRAAGYRNIWTPHAELCHYESATRRNRTIDDRPAMNAQERRTTRLVRTRWGALAEDPAYNPNLTRRSCGFGLAWPPRTAPLSLL